MRVQREDVGDVLVRADDHEAPLVPVHAPEVEDVAAPRVAIPDGGGAVASAISVSMPTARYSRDRLPAWSVALSAAAAAIAADLDAA